MRGNGTALICIVAGAAALGTMLSLATAASRVQSADPVTTFPLSQVRLLDGPFERAQRLNLAYVQALDADRLLAPFRTEAGLKPLAPKYPNWESSGLEGHTAGHYLTALAQAAAATGTPAVRERLDHMIRVLADCQRAHGDGYVGAIPGGRELWRDVAAGRLRVDRFSLNGKWVPWYNLHKLFAGLRDAHVIGGNARATCSSGSPTGRARSWRGCPTTSCRRCSAPSTAG